jgi:pilus assembly protein CpaB
MSETILSNIRVLAIGQNVQERNGEKVVTGETATLELTPAQAELITLAQKIGQLSLALRSLADANHAQDAPRVDRGDSSLTVVRYGVAKQTPKR